MAKNTMAAVTRPPTAVMPITARSAERTVNQPARSGPTTPKITPATTQADRVEPAIAHGNRSARRRASAEPGCVSIGTAHRALNRAPMIMSAVTAAAEKTISIHVTPGPEVTGSINRK